MYNTTCPHCGSVDRLVVTKVHVIATAQNLAILSPLTRDGFEVPLPPRIKDGSTTDERVHCVECGKTFDLTEVME